jgi:ubiquinone/menaquinone biosynthesis C-methylase UbiE
MDAVDSLAFWTAPRVEPGWLTHYLASAEAAYRRPLVAALRTLVPFTAILEIGCHCGPVLKCLRQAFGGFPYTGLDVNASALSYGQHVAQRDGYDTDTAWHLGSVLDPVAMNWPDQTFDLVLSASVLAHVSPADLPAALAAMARVAERAVVLHEPTDERHDQQFHQWAHDYRAAWEAPGFTWTEHDGVLVAARE